MWNEHLQEVIDEFITTIHEMPPEKQNKVVTLVKQKLASHQLDKHNRTLTNPLQHWILPPGDLQRAPYIPPPEQRVEQRVTDTTNQDAPPTSTNYELPIQQPNVR